MKKVFLYSSPIVDFGLAEESGKITDLFFGNKNVLTGSIVEETALLKRAHNQLQEYFAGTRKTFDLPLETKGTEFQRKVWDALQKIPYGQTRSYKDIAENVNSEKAYRAVGMANNKNPIAIIIPCHRVIGTNGKLVGFAGGLGVKEELLALEQKRK